MIKLFDIKNGKVIPTEHCYSLTFLRRIMEKYPEDYLSIYLYLFYMTCPDPALNPFFHLTEEDKEDIILEEVDAQVSLEDDIILIALDRCKQLYETETSRAYYGIKKMLDRLSVYMGNTDITDGRDGNISQLINAAQKFDAIRQSYKGVLKDLQEEQKMNVRGAQKMAYDQ